MIVTVIEEKRPWYKGGSIWWITRNIGGRIGTPDFPSAMKIAYLMAGWYRT